MNIDFDQLYANPSTAILFLNGNLNGDSAVFLTLYVLNFAEWT